jgi:hypothetical protein
MLRALLEWWHRLMAPSHVEVGPVTPAFDLDALRSRWPVLRDAIWTHAVDRATYRHADLVGVEGATLVVRLAHGALRLLSDRARGAAEDRVAYLLGPGASIRFIDDALPHPVPGSRAEIKFDPDRPCVVASDGLLVQRAAVDVLLADGRMSRLGILAGYDAISHEPRRISYVPIHEAADTEVVS